MNFDIKKEEIETRLFKWLLMAGLAYWLFKAAKDYLSSGFGADLWSSLFFFISTAVLLFATRYHAYITTLKLIYCTGWLLGFIYYWGPLGGLSGPMTYIFFSVMAVFIGFIPNRYKEIFAIAFCGTVVALTIDHYSQWFVNVEPLSDQTRDSLAFAYVFHSIVVAVASVLLKHVFDSERFFLEAQNKDLTQINQQLNRQNELLNKKSLKIRETKDNLETLVLERTAELESKHQLLEQYAYNNSHLVRKPLTNIQGLLNVFEIEHHLHDIPAEKINDLRKKLRRLDEITQKINVTIN